MFPSPTLPSVNATLYFKDYYLIIAYKELWSLQLNILSKT